jgi:hypothetical protein
MGHSTTEYITRWYFNIDTVSQGTAFHPSRVEGVVAARWIINLTGIMITKIECPDRLEAMRIHLGFLVVGLCVIRAVGREETDDVVEVGLVRCQHLIDNLLKS